jgi:hypothetical protein
LNVVVKRKKEWGRCETLDIPLRAALILTNYGSGYRLLQINFQVNIRINSDPQCSTIIPNHPQNFGPNNLLSLTLLKGIVASPEPLLDKFSPRLDKSAFPAQRPQSPKTFMTLCSTNPSHNAKRLGTDDPSC